MSHQLPVELLKIKPERRSKSKNIKQVLSAEAVRIQAALPPRCRTIVMDEHGRHWTTAKLADSISGWMRKGGDTAFIIGGADGLSPGIKNSAEEILALSALTLPHSLVRVLLVEQLYRAVSIIKQHPYHRK